MRKRIPILIGILLILFSTWLQISPPYLVRTLIERLEHLGYDVQLRTRVLTEGPKVLNPIVIVDIDDKSLQAEGHWPWPRTKLANLVTHLKNQGATVVAFDILFSEQENNIAKSIEQKLSAENINTKVLSDILREHYALFDNDRIFAQSFEGIEVVLALGFLQKPLKSNVLPPPMLKLNPVFARELALLKGVGYISNIPVLQQASPTSGFINIFPDNDGIVRRAPLIIEYDNGIYASLLRSKLCSLFSTKRSR